MLPLLRSLLFVPANRPERFAKALAAGADAVVIDLEGVPEDDKPSTRNTLADWLEPAHPVIVRINGAGTPWFRDDLALAALPGVLGVMLPKVEQADEIATVAAARCPVLPIIESALGLSEVLAIARAPAVHCLVFTPIDFRLDLGLACDEAELLPYRAPLVLASRVAGIGAPVDGISIAIDDPAALRADTWRSRRLGFGGKLCIHPRQVPTVNACFAPAPVQLHAGDPMDARLFH